MATPRFVYNHFAQLYERSCKHCRLSPNRPCHGIRTHRDPKVRRSLRQIDIKLVSNRMRCIDNTPNPLLFTCRRHLLPRHEHPWRRQDTVEYSHYLSPEGTRSLLNGEQMSAELFDDGGMGCREFKLDGGDDWQG